jgi:hypothetical protein
MGMKTTAALAIAASITLAACQTTGGNAPPLVTYTQAQQTKAAAELRALPKDSELARLVRDYGKTRAAIRAVKR